MDGHGYKNPDDEGVNVIPKAKIDELEERIKKKSGK